MNVYLTLGSTGRPLLRFMVCDASMVVHTKHLELSAAQLKAVQELQVLEKSSPMEQWAQIFDRYFVHSEGDFVTGRQVTDLLKQLGYGSVRQAREFREYCENIRGVVARLGHAGSRKYRNLKLRGSGSVDRK